MKNTIIATVTLNPSLDRTITVHGINIGEANRWSNVRIYAGGKGIDVSRAIHEMKARTIAYGFVGGPAGRTMEILLDEEGVPFNFTPIQRETRTNFIINDSKTSQQTTIDAPGPYISKREFERFRQKMMRIYPSPELIVASGSVPPGIPNDVYYTLTMEAKAFGVRTILDADAQWLAEGIRAKPYLIKPNVREAEKLLGRELKTEEAVIKAALEIVDMGVEIAVISRGADGIIAASSKEVIRAAPPKLKVRSAVGAGDCTAAGLALEIANDQPLAKACRLGVAMGAAAVLTPGTELAHHEDVERLLPQVKVEKVKTK